MSLPDRWCCNVQPSTDIQRMKEDIRRLLGERYSGQEHKEIAPVRRNPVVATMSSARPPVSGPIRTALNRPKSAGNLRPSNASATLPANVTVSDIRSVLIEKINEIALWESQIRFEFEFKLELMEKEAHRKQETIETMRRKVEEKDKLIRTELHAKENALGLREEHMRERLEAVTVRENEMELRETRYERKLKKEVKEQVKSELIKLRTKFYELEGLKSLLDEREGSLTAKELRVKKKTVELEQLNGQMYLKDREIKMLQDENSSLRSKLEQFSNHDAMTSEVASLKADLSKQRQQFREKRDELANEKIIHDLQLQQLEQKLRTKHGDQIRALEDKILKLRQTFRGKTDQWQSKYELLLKELERHEIEAEKLLTQNRVIAKETNDLQAKLLGINYDHDQREHKRVLVSKATSPCCSLCENGSSTDAKLKVEANDLVRKAKLCIEDIQRESRLAEGETRAQQFSSNGNVTRDTSSKQGPSNNVHANRVDSPPKSDSNGESDGYVDW